VPPAPPRRFLLAIAAIFKRENDYLREWLEYHRLVGVDHFYLYDDDGGAAAAQLLAPYAEAGVVTRHAWTHLDGTRYDRATPLGQRNKNHLAFAHAARHHRREAQWLLKLDLDEFLVPVGADSVRPALLALDPRRWKGLRIPRWNFGSSGWLEKPPGLVSASYLRREALPSNHKDLANGDFLSHNRFANSAHWWHYRWWRGGRLLRAERVAALRIHHYYTKSRAEYLARQNTSGGRARTHAAFAAHDARASAVEDPSLLRFQPELEARLARASARAEERAHSAKSQPWISL